MKSICITVLCICLLGGVSLAQGESEATALETARGFKDKKDYPNALTWFQKAGALNPANGKTYYDIAWCQNELKLYDAAILTAEKGTAVFPSANLYFEYGFALFKKADYDKAILMYKKAIVLNPAEVNAVKGIADAFYLKKEYAASVPYYERCITLGFDVLTANYKLGYIMNEEKNYPKAIEYESAAIAADDTYAAAYNERAFAYDLSGKTAMALKDYLKASELDSANATYLFNVADIYFHESALKNTDEAMRYYEKGLRTDKNNAVANFRVGWILNEKEQYREAQPYLYKAVAVNPNYADAWIELGWIDYTNEEYFPAEAKLKKAILLNSRTELGRYYLGMVYIEMNKAENVRQLIDELKAMKSSYADLLKAKL